MLQVSGSPSYTAVVPSSEIALRVALESAMAAEGLVAVMVIEASADSAGPVLAAGIPTARRAAYADMNKSMVVGTCGWGAVVATAVCGGGPPHGTGGGI